LRWFSEPWTVIGKPVDLHTGVIEEMKVVGLADERTRRQSPIGGLEHDLEAAFNRLGVTSDELRKASCDAIYQLKGDTKFDSKIDQDKGYEFKFNYDLTGNRVTQHSPHPVARCARTALPRAQGRGFVLLTAYGDNNEMTNVVGPAVPHP
jgi:hypothetical protein